ncbi:MAG: hypothetical protein ACJA1L_002081 [Paracoccaceae bacterium]|jgi:hypothetical protein
MGRSSSVNARGAVEAPGLWRGLRLIDRQFGMQGASQMTN